MNRKEQCRTCLCNNKEMRSIQAVITIAGDHVKLSDILRNFYNYKVPDEDFYPDMLCINCVTQLTTTYSFKVLIETSFKTLTNTIFNSPYVDDRFDSTFELKETKPTVNNPVKNSYADDNFDSNFELEDIKPTVNIPVKRKRKIKIDNELEQEIVYCVECKSQFTSRDLLYNHCVSRHPNNQLEGKKCDYCNCLLEDFRSLVIHRKLHENPYLCENCWKGYRSLDELNNHMCQPKNNRGRDKVKSGQAVQQCDQCGKSYPSSYMRVHMMIHGNDLKYSCKYCPKKFKVPGSLNSHILWNHKRTRNHKCEVCNATFISASSRSTHIRKHHLKEKKYSCESCAKRFFSKSELERHMLTHTGVKNFHCQLCEKSYQTRHGLNVHLKSHSL